MGNTEKLEYLVNVALKCGAALGRARTCLETLSSPWNFMECVHALHRDAACNEAIETGCGVLEPKCSRCKTNNPMSNQKHGCLWRFTEATAATMPVICSSTVLGGMSTDGSATERATTGSMAVAARPRTGERYSASM